MVPAEQYPRPLPGCQNRAVSNFKSGARVVPTRPDSESGLRIEDNPRSASATAKTVGQSTSTGIGSFPCNRIGGKRSHRLSVRSISMHRIKTTVLFIVGVLALLNGMMLLEPFAAIKPVRDSSGAVAYQRPGRILMQPDYWADIREQWRAELSLLVAAGLFTWCLIRLIRHLCRRFHAPPQ